MTKRKTTQTTNQQQSFNQQNQFSQIRPEDTPDISAYRDWRPQVDPGLAAQYGNARNRLTSSFNDPLGGYGTAQTRDAQQRTGLRQLNQDESQAFRQGAYNVNQQRFGQLGSLASLTAPRIVQSGASGTGTMSGNQTTVQGGSVMDILGPIIGAGATVASGGLTGGGKWAK